jgi:hypothetical protein
MARDGMRWKLTRETPTVAGLLERQPGPRFLVNVRPAWEQVLDGP